MFAEYLRRLIIMASLESWFGALAHLQGKMVDCGLYADSSLFFKIALRLE